MDKPITLAEHCYYFLAHQPKNETLQNIMAMMPEQDQIQIMILINNGCPVETVIKSFWQYMGVCENMKTEDDNDE